MEAPGRAWGRRWVVGDWSVRRAVTGAAFLYGSVCAFAWLAGDRLMFRPHPAGPEAAADVVRIRSTDGATIAARFLPAAARPARGAVLYSHGNAEDLGDVGPLLAPLRELGLDVLAYDYQGYGASDGAPSAARAQDDILAAYQRITTELGVPPDRVVVYGRSIGSGPSVWLAAHRRVGALILEGAFESPFRVVTRVRLLPIDPFPNLEALPDVRVPLLVVHAERDEVVPVSHGRALFAAARAPKSAFWSKTAGHADVPLVDASGYREALAAFLDGALPRR